MPVSRNIILFLWLQVWLNTLVWIHWTTTQSIQQLWFMSDVAVVETFHCYCIKWRGRVTHTKDAEKEATVLTLEIKNARDDFTAIVSAPRVHGCKTGHVEKLRLNVLASLTTKDKEKSNTYYNTVVVHIYASPSWRLWCYIFVNRGNLWLWHMDLMGVKKGKKIQGKGSKGRRRGRKKQCHAGHKKREQKKNSRWELSAASLPS